MESTHVSVLAKAPRGYSLAEMLIVFAIIGILSIIVINGQNDFNRSLTITDSAYTVALSVRQAQTFGLSSRRYGGTNNNAAYGAYFAIASPKSYLLYIDLLSSPRTKEAWCKQKTSTPAVPDDQPGNCLYDSTTETFQNFTFSRGFTITKLCGREVSSGTLRCSTDTSNPLTAIDMVFLRPNSDSIITGTISGASAVQLKDANIVLSAPSGAGSRLICLSYAGQVSVASSTCPQ
jgi:prepilin-type N-terminal cleavage/methylation domain-containing protein